MTSKPSDRLKPSRAMISGEVSWAFLALVLAWSGSGWGWTTENYLYYVIISRQGATTSWALFIGIPALLLLFVSGREYLCSKRKAGWSVEQLYTSARIRFWLCVALAFSWLYIMHALLDISTRMSILLLVSIGGVLFSAWFIWENGRVKREYRKECGA